MTNEMKAQALDALMELGKKWEVTVSDEVSNIISDVAYDLGVNLHFETHEENNTVRVYMD